MNLSHGRQQYGRVPQKKLGSSFLSVTLTSAHKKTWSFIDVVQPLDMLSKFWKMFPPKMLLARVSYTSFQIQMSSGKMLHKRNFMRTLILTN